MDANRNSQIYTYPDRTSNPGTWTAPMQNAMPVYPVRRVSEHHNTSTHGFQVTGLHPPQTQLHPSLNPANYNKYPFDVKPVAAFSYYPGQSSIPVPPTSENRQMQSHHSAMPVLQTYLSPPPNHLHNPSYLQNMQTLHRDEQYPASPSRPFQCDMCPLSFNRQHDLKRHRETHSGDKPFLCEECGKSFTRKDALKRHQTVKKCGNLKSE